MTLTNEKKVMIVSQKDSYRVRTGGGTRDNRGENVTIVDKKKSVEGVQGKYRDISEG